MNDSTQHERTTGHIVEALEAGAAPKTSGGQDHNTAIVDMVREISRQTQPQEMISIFRNQSRRLYGAVSTLSVSRRDLERPKFRITRSTRWQENIDPWKHKDRLPLLSGGLLSDLVYGGDLKVISDLALDPGDPAFEYFSEARSLVYLPLFEKGEAINGVVRMSSEPDGFDKADVAGAMVTANLFGWATSHLLTVQELQCAQGEIDLEMRQVAAIQRSLLPERLPSIETLDLAVSYNPAARAGGDYYDFFELKDGRWGILIADVSGHGTPAAVVMAMLRTMLHAQCRDCLSPTEVMCSVNRQLCDHSDRLSGTFVTAFYGVYDGSKRTFTYASAGHPPPLLVGRDAGVRELDHAQALPLAVSPDCDFTEHETKLNSGDTLLLYTDGITEAVCESGEQYGHKRLLGCVGENVRNAQHIIDCVTHKLLAYTGSGPQEDDQTLLAIRLD